MIDLSNVINKIDVKKVLDRYGFERQATDGKFIRSACKLHEGDNPTAFVINTETSLWYCHTGCGGGDIFSLVQKAENCSFVEALNIIVRMFNIDIDELNIQESAYRQHTELKAWMELMKRENNPFVLEKHSIVYDRKPIKSYRNFDKRTLEHFGVHYIESVDLINKSGSIYNLKHRIGFPINFNGIEIGISMRRINNEDIMKWSHQPTHIQTSEILFNFSTEKQYNEIVVCEGILDVMAYHEIGVDAVATFGCNISKAQERLILQSGADVTLSFDGDKAGISATEKAVNQFIRKATVRTVSLPDEQDPESIPREDLAHHFNDRKRILSRKYKTSTEARRR